MSYIHTNSDRAQNHICAILLLLVYVMSPQMLACNNLRVLKEQWNVLCQIIL